MSYFGFIAVTLIISAVVKLVFGMKNNRVSVGLRVWNIFDSMQLFTAASIIALYAFRN